MAGKKKQGRIDVALLCTVCNAANYVQSIHKDNPPEKLKKHCNCCKSHQLHKIREKLK